MAARESEIAQDVLALVAKHGDALARMTLTPDSLLRTDLGFRREQAQALLYALHKRFGLSGGVELERYFDGYQISIRVPTLSLLLRLIYRDLRDRWRADPPRPDISVTHLMAVSQAAAWSDPPPLPQPEPMIWVGKSVIAPTFAIIGLIFRCFGLLVAFVILAAFVVQTIDAVRFAADGDWPRSVMATVFVVASGFVILLMAENTQREILARFGQKWDWRQGSFRQPVRVQIAANK